MNAQNYGPTVLRLGFGIMFVMAGLSKLMNPSVTVGMLDGLGFPIALFWAWVLILSEIVFGTAVLVGYKVRYTVWPLVVVFVVAALTVHIPALLQGGPGADIMIMFHILGIAGLVSLFLSGAGKMAVD